MIVEGQTQASMRTFDELPEEDLPQGVQIEELCEGLKAWTNPINQFRVLRLHRSADPDKRTEEWLNESRKGMSYMDWLREVEIFWTTYQGKPVYMEEFSRDYHVAKAPLGWAPSLAMMRGWDFGLNPACIFAQLLPQLRLVVLREIIGQDIDLESFLPEVARLSQEWFGPCRKFYDIIDPAGTRRAETDGNSCRRMLTGPPLNSRYVLPGVQDPTSRRSSVVSFLQRSVRGAPGILIDPSCDYIIRGFEAGYHYGLDRGGRLKEQPEKNEFSHPHDALQYICTRATYLDMKAEDERRPFHIIEPKYNLTDVIGSVNRNGSGNPSWYSH